MGCGDCRWIDWNSFEVEKENCSKHLCCWHDFTGRVFGIAALQGPTSGTNKQLGHGSSAPESLHDPIMTIVRVTKIITITSTVFFINFSLKTE